MLINQAVILCGGKGLRLKALTKKIPKPLLKINKKPFIEYLIKNLSRQGINKVILLCGYKSEKFFIKYHNKNIFNSKITCIREPSILDTGGAVINAYKKLDKIFYLLNGDTYFDINLNEMACNFNFRKYDGIISILKLRNDKQKKRYAKIEIKEKIVSSIGSEIKSNLINGGIYIFKKKIFNKKKIRVSLEKSILIDLIKKKKIQVFENKNDQMKFIDIGLPEDFKRSTFFLKKNLKKPAIFFDRDGTINKDLKYVYQKEKIIWNKTAFNAIKKLNQNCYVFIITNQSGIGRGFYTEKHVFKLHDWMNDQFRKKGAHIDDFFYAPYFRFSKKIKYRKNKSLRKPNSGMVANCKKKWSINEKKSFIIGDSDVDIDLARKINYRYFRIKFNQDLNTISKKILKLI